MHIVLLTTGYPSVYSSMHGIFFKDQAEALQREKMDVGMIVLNPISISSVLRSKKTSFGTDRFIKNGVRTIVHKFLNIPKWYSYRIYKSLNIGFKLFEEYVKKNGKPDILHIHSYHLGPMALKIKSKYGIPFVITEHSTGFQDAEIPKEMEKYTKMTFKNSNGNISVSQESASMMSNMFLEPFQYVPNVVNTDEFSPKKMANLVPFDFVFFNAGNLIGQKNQKMLIEAFSLLLKKYNNVNLRIAGSGVLEKSLKELTVKLGISERVEFLGLLPRKRIIEEMQAMDAFVLSSRSETFGVVVIESLSCGKPVVSTKCGGPETIISSDELGFLSEQNTESFSAAMEKVYLNRDTFDSLKIREHAIQNYSSKAVATKLITLYQIAISNFKQRT